MFNAADQICPQAFYVAADQWSDSRIVKEFGAFGTAEDFLTTLHRSAVRCYYEVIRADRPCKAYLDLEGEKGSLNPSEGEALLEATVRSWRALVNEKWPTCTRECPRAHEALILDGSRMTGGGWKVSYHVIFPWLTFKCNDGILKDTVRELSEKPELQYNTRQGTRPFVDGNVYTKNRQFRTALSWKLDDNTTTELRPRGDMTKDNLLLSFVTRIEDETWWAPVEDKLGRCATARPRSAARGVREEPPTEHVTGRLNSILELLRLNDHPPGRLTHSGGRNYRWDAPGRPCLFAKLWRPDDPRHGSNGAAITVLQNGEVYIRCFHSTCQRYGAGQGEHLGTLFDEVTQGADLIAPGGTAAPAPRNDRVVAEGGGERDEPSLEITIRAMQATTTPQPMGKCLREVMKQIQGGDSGPLSNPTLRPQPSQEDRPETCEDLRRVEDWLATDGARLPPRLNAYRALKPLVATNTLTATNSQYQRVREESRPKGSEQPAVATTVWECLPQDAWLTVPLGKRPCVGHALLAGAARFVSVGADSLSDSLPGQIPVPGVRGSRWTGQGKMSA